MSTDIYAPSLPHLPAYFDTNASMVKLTISLNVLMFGMGQMVLGPLSDRFGRKVVLLNSILFFTLISFVCTLAQSIEQLIATRMIQGFAGSAEAVICMAIFKDLYNEKQQVRALGIFGMSVALAPAVAPIIGGYIHVWFNWQFNFYLITLLGAFATFLIWRFLPESSKPNASALKPTTVIKNYRILLRNRQFVVNAAIVGVGMGVIYTFITGAPFILIQQFSIPTENFGYYQAAIVAAYFFGSLISARAVDFMQTSSLLNSGLSLVLIGGCSLIALIVFNQLSAVTFTLAFCIMTLGLGPLFAVAPAKAMLATNASTGIAASMLGAFEMLVGGLAAVAVSVIPTGSTLPVGITIGGLTVVTLYLAYAANKQSEQKHGEALDV